MGKRTIIEIDQELCDGLGACIGRCPKEARSVSGAPAPIRTLVLGIDGGFVAQKLL